MELGVVVGDCDESRRPVLHACGFDPPPRGGSHRAGLDRRAGLAGDDEERRAGPAERVADRRGIGRIEHAEPRLCLLASKEPAEHFRRETRSAHAEQHDVGEGAGVDTLRERVDVGQLLRDEGDRVEPSEPVGDRLLDAVIVAPRAGAARPERIGEAVSIKL